ncbi:uncharacterized protein EHS24_002427 [Apiotrichum porosum]|uniref:6-phosphogluconate dehydrogenase NADP-binding domain-containing protein n=1 Tax=Apiotrichum porosum TaxID=105984 RepID=A0A427XIQ0_9TREE|nr:uncharacterized protein EHS24_002427 [Apiotrichum porosum]RSH78698.1 hypothetical protein EHS24_002427 [Apiotrichum porosum]
MTYKIGYVGLGNMGTFIFLNLARHAAANKWPEPCAWNIDQSRYDEIRAECHNLVLCGQLEEVVKRSNVVFTCLLNDPVAEEVYEKLFAAVGEGKVVFVDQSSLKPKTSMKLEAAAHKVGASYLGCPVFGRPDAAKSAQLVQLMGGEPAAKHFVKPLFVPAVAKRVVDAGDEVGKGSALKLLGNSMILGVVEMLAETYALADVIGFDPDVYQGFIRDFFPLYPYLSYGDNISKGEFNGVGGFRLEAGLKDARNALTLGADFGHPVNLPTIALATKHLERAEELCGNDVDWSALAVALREDAGLNPFRKVTSFE